MSVYTTPDEQSQEAVDVAFKTVVTFTNGETKTSDVLNQ